MVLKELVNQSIYILRAARRGYNNPACLWSTGKDSTVILSLIREAFYGSIPWPIIHIDTGFHFKELLTFRDHIAEQWNLDLIVAHSNADMDPFTHSIKDCCLELKGEALKQVVRKHGFDALIVSIRRDEHAIRSMERVMSPRDKEWRWRVFQKRNIGDSPFEALQDAELWDLYATDFGPECDHVRVHPILHWTELDVWRYIKNRELPVNPLYFSRDGKRFRSLGCWPCTKPIKSAASTVNQIITELQKNKGRERAGRHTDKEQQLMETLRSLGYY